METSHAREPIEDDSTADWIVTYADMVTLLLVFFILLFSISSLNLEKFKHAIQSIQVSLGEKNPSIGLLELIEAPAVQEEKISIEDITGLRSREKRDDRRDQQSDSGKKTGGAHNSFDFSGKNHAPNQGGRIV
jgi:flagellar motor protein MotB